MRLIVPTRAEYGKSIGAVHKTDKGDNQTLARFGIGVGFKAWQPEPLHIRQLKTKLARLSAYLLWCVETSISLSSPNCKNLNLDLTGKTVSLYLDLLG